MPADHLSPPRDHWHLRGLNWLSTLTPSQLAAVRRAARVRAYRRGEAVFRPTRVPRHVYLLEEGLVRIFRVSPGGDELTVGYVRPGEIFGEVSVLTGGPRESFAQAARPARILELPKDVFLKVVRSSRPLYEVTKRIGLRLIRCQSRAVTDAPALRQLARVSLGPSAPAP
jgi:CRP-like cAMP-binding protein